MKSTNVGVNMDVAQKRGSGIKLLAPVAIRDYVEAKYDGLPENMKKVILHPYFQRAMMEGRSY